MSLCPLALVGRSSCPSPFPSAPGGEGFAGQGRAGTPGSAGAAAPCSACPQGAAFGSGRGRTGSALLSVFLPMPVSTTWIKIPATGLQGTNNFSKIFLSNLSCHTRVFSPLRGLAHGTGLDFGSRGAASNAPNPVFPWLPESHLHQALRSGGGGFRRLALQNAAVEPAQHAHPRCHVRAEPPPACPVPAHLPPSPRPLPRSMTVPPAPARLPSQRQSTVPSEASLSAAPPSRSGVGFF